ncbi:uncharacterized protein A1O9_09954 [Exophiala aquamarina CBS 119918]|uniref:Uncharacterized protein n=1 Tax=Exophiala aquamarina CBS 119918 TaxID=1182545 RepID=A0A072P1Z7_9EURO|nr:uncharacterized protein A1O9_09954 [Exophiala aquamarina CBS 119918]KEF54159.1 hypothetical protein A1O9_09954 [Exophiala aquamarina CBS 119918]
MATIISRDTLEVSLSRLDARVKDADSAETQDTTVGPFGIIDFRPSGTLAPAAVPSDQYQVGPKKPNAIFEDDFNASPLTEGLLSNPNDFLDWTDLLALDHENDVFLSETAFPSELLNADSQITDNGLALRAGGVQGVQIPDPGPVDRMSPSPPGSIGLTSPTIQKLLRYFRDQVIPKFSAIPDSDKSPWKS